MPALWSETFTFLNSARRLTTSADMSGIIRTTAPLNSKCPNMSYFVWYRRSQTSICLGNALRWDFCPIRWARYISGGLSKAPSLKSSVNIEDTGFWPSEPSGIPMALTFRLRKWFSRSSSLSLRSMFSACNVLHSFSTAVRPPSESVRKKFRANDGWNQVL